MELVWFKLSEQSMQVGISLVWTEMVIHLRDKSRKLGIKPTLDSFSLSWIKPLTFRNMNYKNI